MKLVFAALLGAAAASTAEVVPDCDLSKVKITLHDDACKTATTNKKDILLKTYIETKDNQVDKAKGSLAMEAGNKCFKATPDAGDAANYGATCDKDNFRLVKYGKDDTKCATKSKEDAVATQKWTACVTTETDLNGVMKLKNYLLTSSAFATAASSTTVATAVKMTVAATAAYAVSQW